MSEFAYDAATDSYHGVDERGLPVAYDEDGGVLAYLDEEGWPVFWNHEYGEDEYADEDEADEISDQAHRESDRRVQDTPVRQAHADREPPDSSSARKAAREKRSALGRRPILDREPQWLYDFSITRRCTWG